MIHVIVIGWNCSKYIDRCLKSIKDQKVPFNCQVVLDPDDNNDTYRKALDFKSNNIKVHLNNERKYGLANIVEAIRMSNPNDKDVLITVDADDWLPHENVFTKIDNLYKKQNLLVTYGSWEPFPNPNNPTNCRPYSPDDFKRLRQIEWRGSHLRTFRFEVWKKILDKDLRDGDGEYFKVAWDLAFMWPILEMAGFDRSLFIKDIMYIYNQESPYGDGRLRLQEQSKKADLIRGKEPYKLLQ